MERYRGGGGGGVYILVLDILSRAQIFQPSSSVREKGTQQVLFPGQNIASRQQHDSVSVVPCATMMVSNDNCHAHNYGFP
jgi:hypothetical protein